MEDYSQQFESLWKKTIEFGETNIELIKLKLFDRAIDVISSLIPPTIVFVFVTTFLLFLNLGLALWLGEIMKNAYMGFILVAAFYGIIALLIHFFLHKQIKRIVSDYIIKQVLK